MDHAHHVASRFAESARARCCAPLHREWTKRDHESPKSWRTAGSDEIPQKPASARWRFFALAATSSMEIRYHGGSPLEHTIIVFLRAALAARNGWHAVADRGDIDVSASRRPRAYRSREVRHWDDPNITPPGIWPAIPASCRLMTIPRSATSMILGASWNRSPRRRAGAMPSVTCLSGPICRKGCGRSRRSSSAGSTASRPATDSIRQRESKAVSGDLENKRPTRPAGAPRREPFRRSIRCWRAGWIAVACRAWLFAGSDRGGKRDTIYILIIPPAARRSAAPGTGSLGPAALAAKASTRLTTAPPSWLPTKSFAIAVVKLD